MPEPKNPGAGVPSLLDGCQRLQAVVQPPVAYRAERYGILDSVVTVGCEWSAVMDFQVRSSIGQPRERGILAAQFADTSGSVKDFGDDVGVALKYGDRLRCPRSLLRSPIEAAPTLLGGGQPRSTYA